MQPQINGNFTPTPMSRDPQDPSIDLSTPSAFPLEPKEMSQNAHGPNGIVPSQSARIEVIGVGGGGSNAVNRMIASDLKGVGYRVLNPDAQALLQSAAGHRLQLG